MEVGEQRIIGRILQHQIDVQLVVEEPIQVDDVGVVAERLQAYLIDQLLLHFVLTDVELPDLLDGHQHAGQFMSRSLIKILGEIDLAEFAAAQALPKTEIAQLYRLASGMAIGWCFASLQLEFLHLILLYILLHR